MDRPTLSELAAFHAVAENRSFRHAADQLGVTPSTLSHTIASLERRVGARLLHRTTRSVAPTEAGAALLARTAAILKDVDLALDELRGFREGVSGTVRISAAAPAIRPLFNQVVPEVRRRHPDVHLEFVADGRLLDIVEDGFDAGIRFGDAVPKDMVGVPFGSPSRFIAVASPSYVDAHGSPDNPAMLDTHHCIRMRLASGRTLPWTLACGAAFERIEPAAGLTLSDVPLQIDAAVNGLGIAYVWEEAARPALEAGALQQVMPKWTSPTSRLLLYYPANRRTPPALKAFCDVVRNVGQPSA